MNRKRLIAGLLALLVLAAAATTAQAAEGSRGILYRVTGGQARMYLLGSIHVGSAEMYPFGTEIEGAMAAADTFVYECDTASPEATATVKARMRLPDGRTLAGEIGTELYARVQAVCGLVGLDMRLLDGLTPWAVINTLAVYTTAAEMGAANVAQALELGVEKQVQAYAAANQKQTGYLETLDEQLGVLEGFSPALTAYLLTQECDVIENPQSARGLDASIASWPAWWQSGDAEAFASQYMASYLEPGHEDVCAEYHAALVSARNVRMAQRLDTMLQAGGAYFVTVGLLHLTLPEDSVVAELRKKGYTVELVSRP